MAYSHAQKLGPSLEQINWLGGTICVLTLRRWGWLVPKLKARMSQILAQNPDPVLKAKSLVWLALAEDYAGNSKGSAEIFRSVLDSHRIHLKPADLHMATITLSLNYLVRGKFAESRKAIDEMFSSSEDRSVSLFSQLRPYVEWSKLGAMSFLQPLNELAPVIQSSKAVFSYTNEEEWALTQYLGHLLLVHYCGGSRDAQQIDEIEERFRVIGLSSKKTFLEANFFWIALSLVRLEQMSRGEVDAARVARLLQETSAIKGHPIRDQFLVVLDQRFSILTKKPISVFDGDKFRAQLKETESFFVLAEYEKNLAMSAKESHAAN